MHVHQDVSCTGAVSEKASVVGEEIVAASRELQELVDRVIVTAREVVGDLHPVVRRVESAIE